MGCLLTDVYECYQCICQINGTKKSLPLYLTINEINVKYITLQSLISKDNGSSTVHGEWSSMPMPGVCVSVCLFTALPVGRNCEGGQKLEKANLQYQQPQQHTPLSFSASPTISAFHPIDPISWHSDLHLMQQQLCAVVSVSLLFVPDPPVFTYSLKRRLSPSSVISLHPPSHSFFSLASIPCSLFLPLHLSRPVLCIISLICAEQADPSLPQHVSIDPLPQCVCVILRCSDL